MEQDGRIQEAYARCYVCGSLRWITDAYIKKHGINCPKCGGSVVTGISKLSVWNRLKIAYWTIWENFESNPEFNGVNPWLHPFSIASGFIGAFCDKGAAR